ncbi:MAG: hypothetical protein ABSE64_08105 [Vulcanimicrobiaceae bacterium]|jgi:hypothetical protein
MPLSIQQVRTAFQDAIPRRRDDFERRVNDRLASIVHERLYAERFPGEILQFAIEEVRARTLLAADRVKELVASGWRPENATGVRSAFYEMFAGFDHWEKDPSSDLYRAVEGAFDKVGVHDPQRTIDNVRELGAKQVQISNECMSDLDVFAARYIDAGALPRPTTIMAAGSGRVTLPPWKYDAFICHASEDKASFVTGLTQALTAHLAFLLSAYSRCVRSH